MKKFESGWQKRQRKRELEEVGKQQRGSIDKFLAVKTREVPQFIDGVDSASEAGCSSGLGRSAVSALMPTTDTLDFSNDIIDMPKSETTIDLPLKQENQSVGNVPQTDAALWTINEDLVSYWLQMGPEPCRNQDGMYSKSIKQHGNKVKLNSTKRKLNDSAFLRSHQTGKKFSDIGSCIRHQLGAYFVLFVNFLFQAAQVLLQTKVLIHGII
jgi:hypothetical protein